MAKLPQEATIGGRKHLLRRSKKHLDKLKALTKKLKSKSAKTRKKAITDLAKLEPELRRRTCLYGYVPVPKKKKKKKKKK